MAPGSHGGILEVTVIGCTKLKNTEWLSKQDPYVCLEYGSTRFRTSTCIDGGNNATFREKFIFNIVDGLQDMTLVVWNANTLSVDDLIGSGRASLQKVLSCGYDDNSWSLQTKAGRYAGEVNLIMHYPNAQKHKLPKHQEYAPATPYGGAPVPQYGYHPAPPPTGYPQPPPTTGYGAPPAPTAYPAASAAAPYPSYQVPPPVGYGCGPPSGAFPMQYGHPGGGYAPPPGIYPPPLGSSTQNTYPPPPGSYGMYPPPQY